MNELRSHFRAEFLNRVLFKPLTEAQIERIVDLMFNTEDSVPGTGQCAGIARRSALGHGFGTGGLDPVIVKR
ncbi:hypothetical protein HNR40_010632 [Nonomuraea endophytica]|uniref:Uncharacterized protein n=1 Tax=Nonomuraea endophytica TaxID=714136 RepID=A0A7W8EN66_9ACTN|nr:hypothetical protein [Nonomuraea endophytica]